MTLLIGSAVMVRAVLSDVWNGSPYPSAEPDAVAQRLMVRSDDVYDSFAVDVAVDVSGRVETGACYYRGLRGIAHIDEARDDVRSFGIDWSVPDVPEATAREAQLRVRERLERRHWKLTHEDDRAGSTLRERGFRYEDPQGGDQVDVRWNDSTRTLFVSVYAPCTRVPDAFDEYDWPEAEWRPKG
ncbi:hypothetical protein ACFYO9_32090 [Streptomyces sp. NPDC005863]|uniref:hypothetical protein n=1 Tax=unclassified Streptomyces TaxID=2593676 RepID=UPI0034081547